jgi:hypothetical protein
MFLPHSSMKITSDGCNILIFIELSVLKAKKKPLMRL